MERRRLLLAVLLAVPTPATLAQGPPPPLGGPLPPQPVPAGNPITTSKSQLGKALFWDEQLSSTRTVACGSCHISSQGGSDPRSTSAATSTHPGNDGGFGTPDDVIGSRGVPQSHADGTYEFEPSFGLNEQVTGRKANSTINAGYPDELFWDGRASEVFRDPVTDAVLLPTDAALESQAAGPPTSEVEMGHLDRDWPQIAARVEASRPLALAQAVPTALAGWIGARTYAELFEDAFGSPGVTPARIIMAIATYERTLVSNLAPINLGPGGLTPQEQQGRQVYVVSGCAVCHGGPLLTDDRFHYTGVRPANEDLGRFEVTGNNPDRGRFKTPSLLNVELRGPFFHNGRFDTLEDVVDFYDRGGDFNAPNKSPLVRPLGLSQQQKNALVAFMSRPLTDPRVANEQAPFDRPLLYAESTRVPLRYGNGVAGTGGFVPDVVAIEPASVGNPSFTVGLQNALGGAPAVLVIGLREPALGHALAALPALAWSHVVLDGAAPGLGFGSVSLALPDDPALAGTDFYGRWYVRDAGAPGGAAASQLFTVTAF
ncbi:MAG: hypothetical protein GY711_35270 [bacterium]|nr:hypothetical protein [bacterium]